MEGKPYTAPFLSFLHLRFSMQFPLDQTPSHRGWRKGLDMSLSTPLALSCLSLLLISSFRAPRTPKTTLAT